MNVLSIGNSFSQDATRYLHQIAESDGVPLTCVNLFIGGCSLLTHWENAKDDKKAYLYERNGERTERMVSIKGALLSEHWDVVTLQQCSPKSFDYASYQPYLDNLANDVRTLAPDAKLYIHQTWAYEDGSERLAGVGYASFEAMANDIIAAYRRAAKDIHADGVLCCGQAFLNAFYENLGPLHRDSFHASLGMGRYILAAVWYETLTQKSILKNTWDGFDEPVPDIDRVKQVVHQTVAQSLQ